jgi:hypothetical protein
MCIKAIKWVLDKGMAYELDQATRNVAFLLAYHAHSETGDIYPSQATLADETGLSERQIRRCIKKLIEVGLLDYGDQSVVAHFRADRRPKVYEFIKDRIVQPNLSSVGKMPAKKKRPWSRTPKPATPAPVAPPAPVDNPAPAQTRPDSESRTTGQTGGLTVRQSFKSLKTNPSAHADAGPAEPIDYGAGYALRAVIRERLARQGVVFRDSLPALVPA